MSDNLRRNSTQPTPSSFPSSSIQHSKSDNDPINLTKKKRKRQNEFQNPSTSEIIKVNCIENKTKVNGYILKLTYYKLTLILGPYKQYDFVNNMTKTIQEELSKIKCTKFNYKPIVSKCFNEIKKVLYKEFPILKLDE
jgi:hypothetical protein